MLASIPKTAGLVGLTGATGAAGFVASNELINRNGTGAGSVATAMGVFSILPMGSYLRSSMSTNPRLRPWAAIATGLGIGGSGGAMFAGLELGMARAERAAGTR